MTRKLIAALVAVAALLAGAVTTADGAPPKWRWTETYAERTLMKNLRIPCRYVREKKPQACDVAAAQARVDAFNELVNSCETLACLDFARSTAHVVQTLENVKNGFKLETMECIGSGEGIRFSLFRCRITVLDRYINSNQERVVSGRIAVRPTGKSTFRWSLI